MNALGAKANRYRPNWTEFLNDEERHVIDSLAIEAQNIDARRRQITAEVNLIRQRASQRRLFKERTEQ